MYCNCKISRLSVYVLLLILSPFFPLLLLLCKVPSFVFPYCFEVATLTFMVTCWDALYITFLLTKYVPSSNCTSSTDLQDACLLGSITSCVITYGYRDANQVAGWLLKRGLRIHTPRDWEVYRLHPLRSIVWFDFPQDECCCIDLGLGILTI